MPSVKILNGWCGHSESPDKPVLLHTIPHHPAWSATLYKLRSWRMLQSASASVSASFLPYSSSSRAGGPEKILRHRKTRRFLNQKMNPKEALKVAFFQWPVLHWIPCQISLSENSSVGRVRASQARGRGFDSRFSLHSFSYSDESCWCAPGSNQFIMKGEIEKGISSKFDSEFG